MITPNQNTIVNKFNQQFLLILFLFSFVCVFASGDTYNYPLQSTIIVHRIFLEGIIGGRLFSIFELLVIILSMSLRNKFGLSFSQSSAKEKFLFVFTIIYIIFAMINPNNTAQQTFLGLPLYGVTAFFTHVLFLRAIFFIKQDEGFLVFIKKLIKMIMYFVIFRYIILFILWIQGRGNPWAYGLNCITTEDDTLYLFALVQVIFLVCYFLSNRKKYLLLSGVLIVFQLLSFRRAGFFLSLFSSFGLCLVYYFKVISFRKKIFLITMVMGSCFLLLSLSFTVPGFADKYIKRNFGAFLGIQTGNWKEDRLVQNQHIVQSHFAINQAFKKLDFWGSGHNNEASQFFWKDSSGVHNAFVQIWMIQGFIPFLYHMSIVLILVLEIIKTLRNFRKWDSHYLLIRSSAIIYLFFLFMTYFYAHGMFHLVFIKAVVIRTLLLAFIFKLTPENCQFLYNNSKEYRRLFFKYYS